MENKASRANKSALRIHHHADPRPSLLLLAPPFLLLLAPHHLQNPLPSRPSMPLVMNVHDPEHAAVTTRIVNLGKLMDTVRDSDCFLVFPPPSRLNGMPEAVRGAIIEPWMMATQENREHEWEMFFEANPQILQIRDDVNDFCGKYAMQSQQTQPTQPGSFSVANGSDPTGSSSGRKRRRDENR